MKGLSLPRTLVPLNGGVRGNSVDVKGNSVDVKGESLVSRRPDVEEGGEYPHDGAEHREDPVLGKVNTRVYPLVPPPIGPRL
eukprot:67858-Prorocentrum_minimum.AAC.1